MEGHVSFSVCIPSYHSEDRIKAAVDSVLKQKYPAMEIIICDQGDTDTSFLLNFDSRIKRIWLEEPSTYNARCELIKAVGNDYFIQLDDDDYLIGNALWFLDDLIRKTDYSDVYMYRKLNIPVNAIVPKYNGSHVRMDKERFLRFCTYENLFYNDLLTKCFKRIPSFSYEPKLMRNNEDGHLLLELADCYQSFVQVDRLLYLHTVRSDSVSKVFSLQRLFDEARYVTFLANKRGYKESLKAFNSTNNSIYNFFYYTYSNGAFTKSVWRAFKSNPFVSTLRRLCWRHALFFGSNVEDRRYFYLLMMCSFSLYKYVLGRTCSRQ